MSEEHVCPECGKVCETPQGLGAHKTFQHSDEWHRPWKDEDKLREKYHKEGLSQSEMAEEWGTDQGTIKDYMQRFDIETDKPRNDPTRPPNHKFHQISDVVGTEYERIEHRHKDNIEVVQIHRLLAIATGKLDPADIRNRNIVVHHKSGHGLDNRPENIEVIKRGEHQTMHNLERYS